MLKRQMKICAILFTLIIATCGVVHAQNLIRLLPDELLEVAKKCNCVQVGDFFERPGMVDPPYVYGALPGAKENSAAFWCKEKGRATNYLLVSASREKHLAPWRYQVIFKTSNYPGGLSITPGAGLALDEFVYVDDFSKQGPKTVAKKNNAILSYYDGVEKTFYNLNGRWLIRIRH